MEIYVSGDWSLSLGFQAVRAASAFPQASVALLPDFGGP